jgi:3-deoxy-D-manno-octulosonic-acid transferase
MLSCFNFFFLQDEESATLLHSIGFDEQVIVSGDTRYDRVAAIAANFTPIAAVEAFKGNSRLLIVGSSWPADEKLLRECLPSLPAEWKVVIAPHEIDAAHVRQVQQLFGADAVLFSELTEENSGADRRVLVINNIGMLSRLFAYGDIAFIGGGFARGGIHNILEPSVFGVPVVFGPVYEKFVEAKEMAALNIVFPVQEVAECSAIFKKLVHDEYRASIRASVKVFMQQHTGATDAIMRVIGEKRWIG